MILKHRVKIPNDPVKNFYGSQKRILKKRKKVKIANKYLQKCSSSLGIREKQIKTFLRFHLTPEWQTMSEQLTTNPGKDPRKENPCSLLVGLQTGTVTVDISMENSQKGKNKSATCMTQIKYLLVYAQRTQHPTPQTLIPSDTRKASSILL